MKSRLHWTIPDGRIAGGRPRPLHVRLEVEDEVVAKVSLGIEVRPDTINWQLSLTPSALSAILERVAWAQKGHQDST